MWHYDDVRKENERLRAEIDTLRGQQAQQQDAQQQLQMISDLDKISQWTTLAGVDARIVAGPLTNFEHTLELDKGSNDGIAVDMPVVTGAGLVGRITDVEKSRSVVKLLTDPDVVVGMRLLDVAGDRSHARHRRRSAADDRRRHRTEGHGPAERARDDER